MLNSARQSIHSPIECWVQETQVFVVAWNAYRPGMLQIWYDTVAKSCITERMVFKPQQSTRMNHQLVQDFFHPQCHRMIRFNAIEYDGTWHLHFVNMELCLQVDWHERPEIGRRFSGKSLLGSRESWLCEGQIASIQRYLSILVPFCPQIAVFYIQSVKICWTRNA